MIRTLGNTLVLLFTAFLFAGCGGGGDDGPTVAPPSALSYASPQTLRVDTVMAMLDPVVTGTVARYSVAPALPPGITLDATTGRISGTPTTAAAPTAYTVTAANDGGSTTFALSLGVYGLAVETPALQRIAALGAPISPEIVVRPMYFDPGTLFAKASDPNGLFSTAVTVTARGDGTHALRLTTSAAAAAGVVEGTLAIDLCRDASCTAAQDVPSIAVPYSVRVMASTVPWPGDNLAALSRWAGAPEWSTMQGNAGHTGHVPVSVDPDRFTLRWKTGGYAVWSSFKQPKQNLVTADGLLFVASSNWMDGGVVRAKREADGTEAWQFALSGTAYPTANPAAVSNGVVYFAAGHQEDTWLHARRASDGSAVFRVAMSSQWEDYQAPTIGPNGMVYANAGTYGGLYGFDPQGQQLFFASQTQDTNWTPAVNAHGVHAYTGDRLQVVDPLTGAVVVTIQDPTFQNYVYDTGGAPVLGNDALGSVFAAAYTNTILNGGAIGNSLTNFRTTTGTIAWQVHGVYPTTPGYRDGVVYAVNQNPLRLEARAELDGALSWSWTPDYAGETKFVSEVLLTDNLAFISTDYATHAIDLASHRSVWSIPATGKLALSPSGVLYIHNSNELVAVNVK